MNKITIRSAGFMFFSEKITTIKGWEFKTSGDDWENGEVLEAVLRHIAKHHQVRFEESSVSCPDPVVPNHDSERLALDAIAKARWQPGVMG